MVALLLVGLLAAPVERPLPVYLRSGSSWVFAKMPASALVGHRFEVQPPLYPRLDVSAPEIGAIDVQNGIGVESARTGKGVLIGIIDLGIDAKNPAFLDAQGRSRIVAVWDQERDGVHPSSFDYGNECSASVIAAGTCAIDDPTGHGTHVAGIAAGARSVHGIAPDASIAVVRSTDFTRIVDAVSYLFSVAAAQGLPLVINLSVGGQYGARNGATPLEQILDASLGPGRLMVAAAGNGGTASMHASADLHEQAQRLEIDDMPWGLTQSVHVDFWAPAETNATIGVELWRDGDVVQRFAFTSAETDFVANELTPQGTVVRFEHSAQLVDNRRRIELIVDGSTASALAGQVALVFALSGTGTIEAWVSRSDGSSAIRFGDRPKAGWIVGDGLASIDVPASARSVIAVGAYVSRTSWPSQLNGTQTAEALTLGALAPYSSLGPTTAPQRTGVKPDITAPGSVIVSARAAGLASGVNAVDNQRTTMQGTSMSAPHVAGVVALMLEADPRLDPPTVRDILTRTARKDAATGTTASTAWGSGKVDAKAAVAAAESGNGGCAAVPSHELGWMMALVCTARLLAHRARRERDAVRFSG